MSELAYTHVVAETQVATPTVVAPATKAPQAPVPIPLPEKQHSSGDDRLDASAETARRIESEVSRLHCPRLIADIQRHTSERPPESPSLRQRTGEALSRTQVEIRALQHAGAPDRLIRRAAQSDDDGPHFFGTDRDSFTGDLWADVKSGAVADRIYAFVGGAAEAGVDTLSGIVYLLKPGGIEKALSSLGNCRPTSNLSSSTATSSSRRSKHCPRPNRHAPSGD